jgi:hypothetical protein
MRRKRKYPLVKLLCISDYLEHESSTAIAHAGANSLFVLSLYLAVFLPQDLSFCQDKLSVP